MKRLIILTAILGIVGCKSNKPAQTTPTESAPPPVTYVPPAQTQPTDVSVPAEPGPVTQGPSTVKPHHKTGGSNAVASDTTSKHKTKPKGGAISGTKYTVKAGDTLSKISQRKYGTTKKVKAILKANPGLKPDKIKVGQVITLP